MNSDYEEIMTLKQEIRLLVRTLVDTGTDSENFQELLGCNYPETENFDTDEEAIEYIARMEAENTLVL